MYIYEKPSLVSYKVGDITIGFDERHIGQVSLLQDDDQIIIPIENVDTIRNILADVVTLSEKDND